MKAIYFNKVVWILTIINCFVLQKSYCQGTVVLNSAQSDLNVDLCDTKNLTFTINYTGNDTDLSVELNAGPFVTFGAGNLQVDGGALIPVVFSETSPNTFHFVTSGIFAGPKVLTFEVSYTPDCSFLQGSNNVYNSPVSQGFNIEFTGANNLIPFNWIGTPLNGGAFSIHFARIVMQQSNSCNLSYIGGGIFERTITITNLGDDLDLNYADRYLRIVDILGNGLVAPTNVLDNLGSVIGSFSGVNFDITASILNQIGTLTPGILANGEEINVTIQYYNSNSTGCFSFVSNLQLEWNCPNQGNYVSCFQSPVVQCQLESTVNGQINLGAGIQQPRNYCYGDGNTNQYYYQAMNTGNEEGIFSVKIIDASGDFTMYDLASAWATLNGVAFNWQTDSSIIFSGDTIIFDNFLLNPGDNFIMNWNVSTSCPAADPIVSCGGALLDGGGALDGYANSGCYSYSNYDVYYAPTTSHAPQPTISGNTQLMGNNSNTYTAPISETYINFTPPANPNNDIWPGTNDRQGYLVKIDFCDMMDIYNHDLENAALIINGMTFPLSSTVTTNGTLETLAGLCSYSINTGSTVSLEIMIPFGDLTISNNGIDENVTFNMWTIGQTSLYLPLQPNCPGGGPCDLKASLYHLPDMTCNDSLLYSSDGACTSHTCMVPISCRTKQYDVLCPGCRMQGLYTLALNFKRLDYGFLDSNNDGYYENPITLDPSTTILPVRKDAVAFGDRFELNYVGTVELNDNYNPHLTPGTPFHELVTNNGSEVAGFHYAYARVNFPACYNYVAPSETSNIHLTLTIDDGVNQYTIPYPLNLQTTYLFQSLPTNEFIYDISIPTINLIAPGILPSGYKFTDQTLITIRYVYVIDENYGVIATGNDIEFEDCKIQTNQYMSLRKEDIFDPSDWLIWDLAIQCPPHFSAGSDPGVVDVDNNGSISFNDIQNQPDGEYFEWDFVNNTFITTGTMHLDHLCTPEDFSNNPLYGCANPLIGDTYLGYTENNVFLNSCSDLRYMCVPGDCSFDLVGIDLNFGRPNYSQFNSCLINIGEGTNTGVLSTPIFSIGGNAVALRNRGNYSLGRNPFSFEYRNWANFNKLEISFLNSNVNFIPLEGNLCSFFEYPNSLNVPFSIEGSGMLGFQNFLPVEVSPNMFELDYSYVGSEQSYNYSLPSALPRAYDDTYGIVPNNYFLSNNCIDEDTLRFDILYKLYANTHPATEGVHTTANINSGLENQPVLNLSGIDYNEKVGASLYQDRPGNEVGEDEESREFTFLYDQMEFPLPKLIWSAPILQGIGQNGTVTWEVQIANTSFQSNAPNPWVGIEFPLYGGNDFWTDVQVYALSNPVLPSDSSVISFFNGFNFNYGADHQMELIDPCTPCLSSNQYIFESESIGFSSYPNDPLSEANVIYGSQYTQDNLYNINQSNARYRIVANYDCSMISGNQVSNANFSTLAPRVYTGYACDDDPINTPYYPQFFKDQNSGDLEYFLSNTCRYIDTVLQFTVIGSELLVTADGTNHFEQCDTSSLKFTIKQVNGLGPITNLNLEIQNGIILPAGTTLIFSYLGQTEVHNVTSGLFSLNNVTILPLVAGYAELPADNPATQGVFENIVNVEIRIPPFCLTDDLSLNFSGSPYCYNMGYNAFCGGENIQCFPFAYDHSVVALEMSLNQQTYCLGDDAIISVENICEPYSWNGVDVEYGTNATVYLDQPGTHVFTISDSRGCVLYDSITVTPPIDVNAQVLNCNCGDDSSGQITVTVISGTNPINFDWSNGANDNVNSNLSPGNYELTLTDSSGCQMTIDYEVEGLPELNYNVVQLNHNNCFGESVGSIEIQPVGGTPSYQIFWENSNVDTNRIDNLFAGSYSFIIQDANDCVFSDTIDVLEPLPLDLDIFLSDFGNSINTPYCNNLGTIEVIVNGGTPNYTFVWSNGQNTSQLFQLPAGEYSLVVIDSNSCIIDTLIEIIESPTIQSDALISNILCYGDSTGSVAFSGTGGIGNLSYQWENSSAELLNGTQIITNLQQGIYSLSIYDEQNCNESLTFEIVEPAPIIVQTVLSNYNGFEISCNGDSSGVITAILSGGVSPYSISIDNGSSQMVSDTIQYTGLFSGSHLIAGIDANSCPFSLTVNMSEPNQFIGSLQITQDILCSNDSSGILTVNAQGGVSGYTYIWLPTGENTSTINNLDHGIYSVVVTDLNGCEFIDSVQLNSPDTLNFSSVLNNMDLCIGSDNSIVIDPLGGTSPYSIEINGELFPTGEYFFQNDSINVFNVVISDSNSCILDSTFTISGYPLPVANFFAHDICIDELLYVENISGIPSGLITNEQWFLNQNEIDIPDLNNQMYYQIGNNSMSLVVTSDLGCTDSIELYFTINGLPNSNFSISDTIGCPVLCFEVEPAVNIEAYSYSWNVTNGANSSFSIEEFCIEYPGNYSIALLVTDTNNCASTTTANNVITVFENPVANFKWLPELPSVSNPIIELIDESEGIVTNWNWNIYEGNPNSSNIQNPSIEFPSIIEGSYTIQLAVIDENGCVDSIQKIVSVKSDIILYVPNSFTPNSDNSNETWNVQVHGIKIRNFELQVFNRWGELIWESKDQNYGWDGTYKNEIVQDGIYTWRLSISPQENSNVFQYNGHVNLIR